MSRKRVILTQVLVLALVATLLAACASAQQPTAAPAEPTQAASQPTTAAQPASQDLLDQVMAAGKLLVSTDPNYAPQSFLNDQGQMDGFDIDVAKEVAKRLGVEVEFKTVDWDLITPGGWAGRWDISIGSMTPTEQRARSAVVYRSLLLHTRYFCRPQRQHNHHQGGRFLRQAGRSGHRHHL